MKKFIFTTLISIVSLCSCNNVSTRNNQDTESANDSVTTETSARDDFFTEPNDSALEGLAKGVANYVGPTEPFHEGLVVVMSYKEGSGIFKYGFIDKTDKEVLPCIYDGASGFSEGLARIKKNG
jgi:hypothetical protein